MFKNYKFDEASKKKILTSKHIYCKDRKLNNNKVRIFITATARDTQNNKKFKNEIIRQREVWKKAVRQIEIIMKKVFNIILKSQKSESSTKLYNSE